MLIALGNSGDPALAAVLQPHLSDPSPLVRAMAVWALARLAGRDRFDSERDARLPSEGDTQVCAEWQQGGAAAQR